MQTVSEILQVVLCLAWDSLCVQRRCSNKWSAFSTAIRKHSHITTKKIYKIVQKNLQQFIHTYSKYNFFWTSFNEIALAEFPHQVIKCTVSPIEREGLEVSLKVKLTHS